MGGWFQAAGLQAGFVLGPLPPPSGGVYLSASVHLTAAQIIDLVNTPVDLVASPGVGKFILPTQIVVVYTCGSSPFSGTANQFLAYNPNNVFWVVSKAGDILDKTAPSIIMAINLLPQYLPSAPFSTSALIFDTNVIENQKAQIGATSDFGGDGNGTLDVTLIYAIVDLP